MRVRAGVVVLLMAVAVSAFVVLGATQEVDATPDPVPVSPTPAPAQRSRAPTMTLEEAVATIAAKVDVPVAPPDLPKRTRLVRDPYIRDARAQLDVRLPGRRVLTIQYGQAGFDGCGPLHPHTVKIGRSKGVIESYKHGKRPFSAVIWPATLRDPVGRYGLSGEFTRRQILAFAESMTRRVARKADAEHNC
jgi:hypothetical protein